MQTGNVGGQSGTEVTVTYCVLGEKYSINQVFHPRYMADDTQFKAVFRIAAETYKQLHYSAGTLGISKNGSKDQNLEMLCTCRDLHEARFHSLHNVLDSITNGTFSLTCQQKQCPKYNKCPERRDLAPIREVVPDAQACTWFRESMGHAVTRPESKTKWGTNF